MHFKAIVSPTTEMVLVSILVHQEWHKIFQTELILNQFYLKTIYKLGQVTLKLRGLKLFQEHIIVQKD